MADPKHSTYVTDDAAIARALEKLRELADDTTDDVDDLPGAPDLDDEGDTEVIIVPER